MYTPPATQSSSYTYLTSLDDSKTAATATIDGNRYNNKKAVAITYCFQFWIDGFIY